MAFDKYSEDPDSWGRDYKEYIKPTKLVQNEAEMLDWVRKFPNDCNYLSRCEAACVEEGWWHCAELAQKMRNGCKKNPFQPGAGPDI